MIADLWEMVSLQTHKKKVREKKKQLARLNAQGEKRRGENRELDQALVENQVSVLERQAAEKLAGWCTILLVYTFHLAARQALVAQLVSAFGC